MEKSSNQAARRLRQAVEARGLSQADLAKECEASPGAVSQWLKGSKQPSRENLKTIADVLQVDAQWLEYGTGLGPQPDEEKQRVDYLAHRGWRMRPTAPDGGRDY